MGSCTNPFGLPVKQPGALRPAKDAPLMWIRCGKCMSCRLDHARSWATRITHEASLHAGNSFITLTYDDEHLPDPPTVSKREMQLFFKRLRKQLGTERVRYFACGEYGSNTKRPHYHAILFGVDFVSDRYPWMRSNTGEVLYRSPTLEKVWTLGHALIGMVSQQSAGYVARYTVKKANDFTASGGSPYQRLNAQTGEFYQVEPEFLLMSRHPGIGYEWIDQYSRDAYPSGFLVVDGRKVPVPKSYRRRLKARGSDELLLAMEEADHRLVTYAAASSDNTPERLAVKAELNDLRVKQLKRPFE